MIDFKAFAALAAIDPGTFEDKPTSIAGNQKEAAVELWVSEDKMTEIGVWECTPGTFTADRTKSAEFCHILSGSATLVNEDGSGEKTLRAGDLLVLPLGWKGKWTIHEQLKKTYVINYAAE
nr:cupin domain-containing protein [uncultured Gellertiella sp.]